VQHCDLEEVEVNEQLITAFLHIIEFEAKLGVAEAQDEWSRHAYDDEDADDSHLREIESGFLMGRNHPKKRAFAFRLMLLNLLHHLATSATR